MGVEDRCSFNFLDRWVSRKPLEANELIRILLKELDRLHDDDRKIISSVYGQEQPHHDVAVEMGCPLGSVHHKFNRASRRLKSDMRLMSCANRSL